MNEGDFVEIEYEAKEKLNDTYFDVTNEEKAKEYGLYKEDKNFKPVLVIVGAHQVIEGLDNELMNMDVDEEKTFEIEPAQAFGKRDPKKIKIVHMRDFAKQNIRPYRGMSVQIGDEWAIVKSVTTGRVTLDFNHALAGRKLEYKVKVLRKIEETEEKLKALIEINLGVFNDEKSTVSVDEEGTAIIDIFGLKKEMGELVKTILTESAKKYIPEIKEIKMADEIEDAKESEESKETTESEESEN